MTAPGGSFRDLSTGHATLVLEADFPELTPRELFTSWIEPDRLVKWWPQEAEVEPELGGRYHLSWPGMNWHLRGTYTAFQPDQSLGFTWHWDHEPDMPVQEVMLRIEPCGEGGSRLHLTHGPHNDDAAGRQQREGHVEGWQHFLSRLQALP